MAAAAYSRSVDEGIFKAVSPKIGENSMFLPKMGWGFAIKLGKFLAKSAFGCPGASLNSEGATSLDDVFSFRDGKASKDIFCTF